ncbi:MAG: phosphoribosyltransferase [Kineosporiaceae bacterium]
MTRARHGRYADRRDAGVALARLLAGYAGRHDLVVLGLPRGGVVVAAPVAADLHAPLDVLVVRKLGLPGRPELAMAAVTEVAGHVSLVRNEDVLRRWPVPPEVLDGILQAELAELRRREGAYRRGRAPLQVAGKVALVVDDGLATGASMRAAVAGVRRLDPVAGVVAVPVGAPETVRALRPLVDDLVCPWQPRPFTSVGEAYDDFTATSDDEVLRALAAVSPADPDTEPNARRG